MHRWRKNWENDIFSPFLYCLWFIWTHASSGLKVSRSFMSLRPKKQLSLGLSGPFLMELTFVPDS